MSLEEKKVINELIKEIKKDELKSRLSNLWDDPYISKQMLKAHLNQESDAASRKISTIKESATWIDKNIKEKSKILDLGCGPGLYATELAKKGHSVIGVDLSTNSINYAKKVNEKNKYDIEYINKNYLFLDYENKFDVVLLIYKDFSALRKKERDSLLNMIHKALKTEGLFIFDVTQLSNKAKSFQNKTWAVNEGGFWTDKNNLVLEENEYCKKIKAHKTRYIVITDNIIKSYIVIDKEYSKEDIKELLDLYSEVSFYANVFGGVYDQESNEMAIIAKK